MSAAASRKAEAPPALGDLPTIGPGALLWVVLAPEVEVRAPKPPAARDKPTPTERRRA